MAQIHEHRGRWRKYMKAFFILFVALHLLIDLAMPSLPGAFRFNPDESAVAVRVEPVEVEDLKPAPRLDLRRELFELPRRGTKALLDARLRTYTPDVIVLLPRRDPSADRSSPHQTEDDLASNLQS
ncbi:MAG: hypothetical protein HY724_08080 [Candidatus Rokubacteria bacterium]|nr:hypothetical protein [Candidatus Rokubacteria bacterium]